MGGERRSVEKLVKRNGKQFEIRHLMIGPDKLLAKGGRILHRTIKWMEEGIRLVADERFVQGIAEKVGLERANPVASRRGTRIVHAREREPRSKNNDQDEILIRNQEWEFRGVRVNGQECGITITSGTGCVSGACAHETHAHVIFIMADDRCNESKLTGGDTVRYRGLAARISTRI